MHAAGAAPAKAAPAMSGAGAPTVQGAPSSGLLAKAQAPGQVMPKASANPTLDSGRALQSHYGLMDKGLRSSIESMPEVAQHGVPPHIAAALLNASRRPGEDLAGAVQRYTPSMR